MFKVKRPSQQFSNLFNRYAKSINKAYGRSGSLFENKFGRKQITSHRYFQKLIVYIHHNPQLHGFVDDCRDWPWSSYHAILSDKETRLERTAVLNWFNRSEGFCNIHTRTVDEFQIAHLLVDDFL